MAAPNVLVMIRSVRDLQHRAAVGSRPGRTRHVHRPFAIPATGLRHEPASDYLYACPSFAGGVASVLDLFGVFDTFNYSRTSAAADRRALLADRMIVYGDIRLAVRDTLAEFGLEPYVGEQLSMTFEETELTGTGR